MASKAAGTCEGLPPLIPQHLAGADSAFLSSHRDRTVSYDGLDLVSLTPSPHNPAPSSGGCLPSSQNGLVQRARSPPCWAAVPFLARAAMVTGVADSDGPGACLL